MAEEMIGYCGYSCHLCAARSNDPVVRQQMVDGWRKVFGHQHYTAENVKCDGCLKKGKHADKDCQARPCAIERKEKNCAYCDEFACEKVRHLLGNRERMLIFSSLKSGPVTKEEYDLCMRQFVSTPNIIRMLVKAGKMSEWVLED